MTTESLHDEAAARRKAQAHAEHGHAPGENQVIHTYDDDIEEYDNHLPNWWLVTLYGAIIFAIGYYFSYHVLHSTPSTMQSFESAMAADRAAAAERARQAGPVTADTLRTLAHDPATVRDGQAVFQANCVACHGPGGGGTIGPNLTDNSWIHGGSAEQIYHTVLEGVVAKGMPAWGAQIGPRRVQSAVAYVLTLRNTNVPGGKAAQGDVSTEE